MRKTRDDIKKVGITGAAGVIGTALREGLAGKYELKLYDIKDMKEPLEGEFIKVDFAKREELSGIFNGLDALIHLAGNPNPGAPPKITIRNNFAATSYIFEEARLAGVKKIVYASSNFYHEGSIMEAMTGGQKVTISLDTPPTPQCWYARSKVFGENVGRHYSHLDIQFIALRIGWTVPEDSPVRRKGPYMQAMFCSKRDLVQAFDKALEVDVDFMPAFVISDNDEKIFDMRETKVRLGFEPQDNSENYS